MAAHLYWRVHITVSNGGVASIAEVQYYNASGTLLSTGGTATASSTFSSQTASLAHDGNFTTFWASNVIPNSGAPEWIKYQFAAPVDVSAVRISRRPAQPDQLPLTFSIQYSDDNSSWTVAGGPYTPAWLTVAQANAWSFKISGTGYVNVRALVNATQDGTAPDAAELEFRESPGGANIAVNNNQYSIAGQLFSGTAGAAFDGSGATAWLGSGYVNNWIGQCFARPVNVVELRWQERNDSEYTEGPTSITLQGSNDGGGTWTNLGRGYPPAAWTSAAQAQIISIGAIPAKAGWRLLFTATTGTTVVAVEEVQMYDAGGALLTPLAAASSSNSSGLYPGAAWDANNTTFWASNVTPSVGSPEWLRYEFSTGVDVALIRLTRREGTGAPGFNQSPTAFKLQWSDDWVAWTDAASFTTAWDTMMTTISFPVSAPASQYANYRALITATQSGGTPSGAEFQLRAVSGGANVASSVSWHSQALNFVSGNEAYKAFDGNAATFWLDTTAPGTRWLGTALNRALAVVEITWQARNDANFAQAPSAFKLQGSNDGTAWVDVASFTAGTWTTGQTQTFSLVRQQPMVTVA